MSNQTTITAALAALDNPADATAACLIAGGIPPSQVPEDPQERYRILSDQDAPRLALHALANVHAEAPPSVEQTEEWQDYRADPDPEAFLHDTWCDTIARLLPWEERERWTETADQHLETLRNLQANILPEIRAEHPGRDQVLTLAVARATADHSLRHGCLPGGHFAFSVLEAVLQTDASTERRPSKEDLPL